MQMDFVIFSPDSAYHAAYPNQGLCLFTEFFPLAYTDK